MANNPYSDDKYQFKFNFITKLPPGVILVSQNVFTGEVKNVSVSDPGISNLFGLKKIFINWFPWVKTKYITALSKTLDYTEGNYITKDRVNLTVDISAEVRIVEGGKYEYESSTVSERLKNVIDGAVRRTIIKYTADDILNSNFDLNGLVRPDLDAFKDKYGVEVVDITLQNLRFSSDVSKSFEKKFTAATDAAIIREMGQANADVQEKMNRIEIEKERAKAGVAVSAEKARNENEINQMNQLLELIKNCGPEQFEQLSKLAYPMLLNNGGNKHLFVQSSGGSGDSTNAIMAAAAEEGKPKTR